MVFEEELNNIAMARPRPADDVIQIPSRQWAEPAPLAAECPAGASGDLLGGCFAGKEVPGGGADERWIPHDTKAAEYSNESHPA